MRYVVNLFWSLVVVRLAESAKGKFKLKTCFPSTNRAYHPLDWQWTFFLSCDMQILMLPYNN